MSSENEDQSQLDSPPNGPELDPLPNGPELDPPPNRPELDPRLETRPELDPPLETRPELDPTPETRPELDPTPETRPKLDPRLETRPELDPPLETRPELDPTPETRPELDPPPETRHELDSPPENRLELISPPDKKPQVNYTREFLLSFSELEACKKVPNGLDPSILRELHESSSNVLDRPRGYGANPNTYSKSGSSRWDTRSTESSEKDGDTQSERDSSVPDRRYGQYQKRNWQASGGHDGLLGKPSGFVPNNRTGTYQLNRTSEPYQPPRPYKAGPYKKDVDSCNDETFGSNESSAQEKEEERKRRASFEVMRKEQHKVLQEKQTQKEKEKENDKLKSTGEDILGLLQGSNSNESTKPAISQKDDGLDENVPSSKPSSHSRPLVPPGFVPPGFAGGERKLRKESSNASSESEVKNGVTTGGSIVMGTPKETQIWEDQIANEKNKEIMGSGSGSSSSISILEKFFGSALSKNNSETSPSLIENNELPKAKEETLIPPSVSESSKFAHWFIEEDTKNREDSSSEDFLSLFSKNPNKEKIDPISNFLSPRAPLSNGPYQKQIPKSTPPVLTCEDVEQLMLAQAGISNNNNNNNNNNNSRRNPRSADVDNSASNHLLSLLQHGAQPITSINPSTNLNAKHNASDSRQGATLEALFGASFMNELHSMDAPVSSRQEVINLPEEESLLSVNDPPLNLRPNDNSSSSLHPFTANPSKTEGLYNNPRPVQEINNTMLNYRFGPDTNIPVTHLQVPPGVPLSHDPNVNQRMGQFHRPSQFEFDQAGRHVLVPNAQFGNGGFGSDMGLARHGPRPGPRPVPVPHPLHQVRHSVGLPHEMAGVRNFSVHQVQPPPNFGHVAGGSGMGRVGGSNQIRPEELERLMQMELRAKAQQQAGRVPGYFGPELDLDFRYR